LYNLRARHLQGQPYTRVGDLIVAVNPFQWKLDLYTQSVQNQYVNQLVWNGKSMMYGYVYV
jgi:myosin-5